MIPLGLSAAEQKAFHKALVDSHEVNIRVNLLDMEENVVAVLQPWLLGGQVVVDSTEPSSGISRSCQLTLLDPEHRAGIDPDSPGTSTYLNRMIHVSYGVWVEEIDRWVRVPIFRGPIAKASRDGDILEIEALGKEHLLKAETGWAKTYRAGLRRTTIIAEIARKMGERNMVIPSWAPRTSKTGTMISLGVQSHPWSWMRIASNSMRAHLWYDGAGTLRLRKKPVRTSWWFKEHHLLSEPKVTIDDQDVFNHVWVKGQAPEGKNRVIEGRGSIAHSHPNAPRNLGRRDAPRYLTDIIEDDQIRSNLDARTARDRRLRELEVETYQVEFDCFVVPHLDPEDLAHLGWGEAPGTFRVRKFTIPLGVGEAMSVGYNRETRRTPSYKRANAKRSRQHAVHARLNRKAGMK